MEKYDAIVIGFGKGGKTLAGKLGASGKKVAMIEKSDMMYGGTCINVGCIPSKSLVHSAARSAYDSGADRAEKAAMYKKAVEEKRALTAMLRKRNYDKLNNDPNITVIDGEASFKDSHTVLVKTASGVTELYGENIFINTGSVSVVPKIDGIENNSRVYFSDSMMDLDILPERLVIIGGGYIGLEFASMYANFGSKVTVIQDGDVFIPREDADIAEAVKDNLEKQGVSFIFSAKTQRIAADGTVTYTVGDKSFEEKADAVLVATGRRPNTDGLGLEKAGVEVSNRGAVVTDKNRRTSQSHIFAMGDVVGGLQFTFVSLDDYRVVLSALTGGDYDADKRRNVPYSVFMATPLARVGLNEKEASDKGVKYRVLKFPTAAVPKAQVLQRPQGFMKALVDPDTGKILGAMLLCEESYEMINTIKLAMDLGADYKVLRDQIYTHPTMTEALNDLFAM